MPTTSAVELSSSAPAGANVETVVAIGYRCVRSAAVPSPPLGNADSALHCAVLDRAASLSVDDEIAAHSIDVDTAGPLRLDAHGSANAADVDAARSVVANGKVAGDRKSTRLNSSHLVSSYAVFCLKKKTATLVTI